jgi:hypothetical protein
MVQFLSHSSDPRPDINFQAIYCMLYILCVWALLRRKRNGFMWQLASSTLLFALETVNLALEGAYVLYNYFASISAAENWLDSPYRAFQPDRTFAIINMGVEVASLLCLCVQLPTSDVISTKILIQLAGWRILYWHVPLNLPRAMQIYSSFRSTVVTLSGIDKSGCLQFQHSFSYQALLVSIPSIKLVHLVITRP